MPRTRLTMIVTISLAALLLIGISATRGEKAGANSTTAPSIQPTPQVASILGNRCYAKCHKPAWLMARVVPGDAPKSRLYRQAARGHNRKGKNGVCTADEVKVLADWINSLTSSSQPASEPASQPASRPHKETNM